MPISLPYNDKDLERLISREKKLTTQLKGLEENISSHLLSLNKEQAIRDVLKQNFNDIALIKGIHSKEIYASAGVNKIADDFEKHLFEYKDRRVTIYHDWNNKSYESYHSFKLYYFPFVTIGISIGEKVIAQQKVFSLPYAIHIGDLNDCSNHRLDYYQPDLFERNPNFKKVSMDLGINLALIAKMIVFNPKERSIKFLDDDCYKRHHFFYDSNGKKQATEILNQEEDSRNWDNAYHD